MLFALFVYFLLSIPVFLGLALAAQLTRRAALRRAAEAVMLSGGVAMLVVLIVGADEEPKLWVVVGLLAVLLAAGLAAHVRAYRRP